MLSRLAAQRICGTKFSSEPQSPRSSRYSQVWTWKERSTNSGGCSVQDASRNREYGTGNSGSFGNPRVHAKSRSKHERPTRTRWKCLGNIDGLQEDAYYDMDAIYGFIDAGGTAHGPELRQEFWIYSRILNLRTSKICSALREWWSKEIHVVSADVASSLWGKSVLRNDQAIKWTKAGIYVYSESVLCFEKMYGPEDAVKRWTDQVSTLKMCHTFWDLKGKHVTPENFSDRIIFMSMLNWKGKITKILVLLRQGRSKSMHQNLMTDMGILGSRRRKQLVSRILNQFFWPMGS